MQVAAVAVISVDAVSAVNLAAFAVVNDAAVFNDATIVVV